MLLPESATEAAAVDPRPLPFPTPAVAGIYYSDDKMLQTRIFSYQDTQRYRCAAQRAQRAQPTRGHSAHSALGVPGRLGAGGGGRGLGAAAARGGVLCALCSRASAGGGVAGPAFLRGPDLEEGHRRGPGPRWTGPRSSALSVLRPGPRRSAGPATRSLVGKGGSSCSGLVPCWVGMGRRPARPRPAPRPAPPAPAPRDPNREAALQRVSPAAPVRPSVLPRQVQQPACSPLPPWALPSRAAGCCVSGWARQEAVGAARPCSASRGCPPGAGCVLLQ